MNLRVRSSAPLRGEVRVGASKYHEHRALILAAMADGPSRLIGTSGARHVAFTRQALRDLGTRISTRNDEHHVEPATWMVPQHDVSMGSSGTTLYLLLGLLTGTVGAEAITVTAQRSLRSRPLAPLVEALSLAGLRVEGARDHLPLTLHTGGLAGGDVTVSGHLSQWVSGVLMSGVRARRGMTISIAEPRNESPYVDLTISMLARFGVEVDTNRSTSRIRIAPGQRIAGGTMELPADYSSAAFLAAAAALVPDSDVFMRGSFNGDHPEAGLVDVLQEFGVDMTASADGLRVRHSPQLRGVQIDCRHYPDAFPVLAVLAAHSRGTTVFRNISHIRDKESDRVNAMLQLRLMGVDVHDEGESVAIAGAGRLNGTRISSFNDHRVQMAFTVAGLVAQGESQVTFPRAHHLSYPNFHRDLQHLGALGSITL